MLAQFEQALYNVTKFKGNMSTVFNTQHTGSTPFMFFGEEQSIYRIDKLVQPSFDKLARRQKGFFWQPEEIDVTKDQKDFKLLDAGQEHIFTSTLTYQNMLDSVQGRGPDLALLPHASLPELEAFILWWSAMEQTHADSYSYIVRNVYSNPTAVFDQSAINPNIITRAKNTIKYYDDFLDASIKYRAGVGGHLTETELKRKFLLMIVSINALEGLSFYQSFACSFAFAEQGLMVGNSNIISLIARDENLHLAGTQTMLKLWREGKDDPVFKQLYFEEIDQIKAIYENIVQQEKEWSEYLFSRGSMLGLNEQILGDYVEYIAGLRLKNLGIKHDYAVKNPLPWTLNYLNTSDKQVAPQEQEILTYTIGGIKNDLERADFKKFRPNF